MGGFVEKERREGEEVAMVKDRRPTTDIIKAVIGQISRPVALFLLGAQYNGQLEETIHRAMLGEKIPVQVAGEEVFVVRNVEFDNWWMSRS